MASLSHESSSWPHPSSEPAGGCGLHWGLSGGHDMEMLVVFPPWADLG